MPFLQFTLDIGARDPAPYEDALFGLGAHSVTLLDAADDPVLEPAPGAMPLWPTVVIRAVFPADIEIAGLRDSLAAADGLDAVLLAEKSQFESVADRAWEREWLKDFRPMRFGQRLWVCPDGQAPRPEQIGAAGAVLLALDPGLAFGTGTHATTALCLEWLDSGALPGTADPGAGWLSGAEVVDYGCGSGILAIAALRLGARRAVAMDIDPQALLATRENAERNSVLDRLNVTADPELSGTLADVVVANILASPLVELAPVLAQCTRPGGRIALSGLLVEQADTVTAAYRPWFDIGLAARRDGWGLLTGRRHLRHDAAA